MKHFAITGLVYGLTSAVVLAQGGFGEYHPDTISFNSFRYRNLPFETTTDELETVLGEPDTVYVFGKGEVKTLEAIKKMKETDFGLPPEALYQYGDTLSYRVQGRRARLANVNFRGMSENKPLEHPKLSLSKSTTLKDMQSLLPNSYASRNLGVSGGAGAFESEKEQKKYTFMHIIPTSEDKSKVAFVHFYEDKLDQITF